MNVVVKNNGFGVSARKVRQVCDLIRNKKPLKLQDYLGFVKKEISLMLTKLLNSGLTIATDTGKMDLDNIVVSRIIANEAYSEKSTAASSRSCI